MDRVLKEAKVEEREVPVLFGDREKRIKAVEYFSEQYDAFWGLAEVQDQEGYILLEDLNDGNQVGISDTENGVLIYINKLIKGYGAEQYDKGQNNLRIALKQMIGIELKTLRPRPEGRND